MPGTATLAKEKKVVMAERSNALKDDSVITLKCDGLTTIFLPKELFHDSEFNNNLYMLA